MPSVAYDRSLYRTGFRPAFTDPFAASQMSGIFSQEFLHGMGQGGPVFTRTGGWALHGLGDLGGIVPEGSLITYQGTWPLYGQIGAADLINRVSAALPQSGLTVRGASSDAGFLANTPDIPFVGAVSVNVTLRIQVTNGMGFGDPNDIIAIVRHYVYQITGQFPIADSVPTIQPPSGGGEPAAVIPTGQPEIPGAPRASGTQDWGKWLQDNALLLGALVVGAMVLPKVL